jgi:IS5 family transposase
VVAQKAKNSARDFRGEKRTDDTHASVTDPDAARLYKKSAGSASKIVYLGHVMTENRNGIVVDARLSLATGTAEREAALEMLGALPTRLRVTVCADNSYDAAEFVDELRALNVTPHTAQNDTSRRSATDGRTPRHPGYVISQRKRKRVEEVFGWGKVVGLIRKAQVRGLQRVGGMFTLAMAAYNLVRIRKLNALAT